MTRTTTIHAGALTALDVIYGRRSVRAYKDTPLNEATIRGLLDAAVQAPTAMHLEPWAFVVVQDPDALKRYSERVKTTFLGEATGAFAAHLGDPDFSVFYDAPVLIIICAKPLGTFVTADCWMAAENLMLAACAMGLGSCCVGAAVSALSAPDVREELGIPADYLVVAPVVVGVAKEVTSVARRKNPEILSWKGSH